MSNALPEASPLTPMTDWNETHVAFPPAVCVHQMVEAQAQSTPNAAAVTFDGRELSHAELDRRANQLARHLQTLGAARTGDDRKFDARAG